MPSKNLTPKESVDQRMLCQWMTVRGYIFFAIPNGGYRRGSEAHTFKLTGVKRGVPDLCIPMARKGFYGLYIELKRLSGSCTSEEQKWWIEELQRQGYRACFAHGFDEARKVVEEYFAEGQ